MSYKIIGKYINDLDFKIPNSKSFTLLTKNISNYKINIDIKSIQLKEKIVEVETSLSLLPSKNNNENIVTKIIHASIVEIDEKIKEKRKIEKIILIDVPNDIYPELRKIFIFIFESSGFKEINISKNVDFQKLYDLKKIQ